jgi:uroporphyrinogen-III synthase
MVQDKFPLKGKTVAITRPSGQAEETGKLIQAYKATPYFIPSIEIKPTCDTDGVKRFVSELQNRQVDYVLFMSVNGVRYLLSCCESLGEYSEVKSSLNQIFVVAVGPKTANALKKHDITVDLVPEQYSSEGLIPSLKEQGVSGKSIWIPRTSDANPVLATGLASLGANVHELYVYESLLPSSSGLHSQFLECMRQRKIDAIIFGSSSSATNLFKMLRRLVSEKELKEVLNPLTVVAIGPITAKTLHNLGIHVDLVPQKYLFEDALDSLANFFLESG